jgi:predicted enzyme related to lactoylglutathione lyase
MVMRIYLLIVVSAFLSACAPEESALPVTENADATRPDIIATNAFYYYADVDAAWSFYRDTLGLETVVDYGFAKIVRMADSSYLTLVQASEGMHSVDEPKTVTLNLVTDELNRWHAYLAANDVPMQADLGDVDGAGANSFVAVDPEGYYLKFVRYDPEPNGESFVAAFADVTPVISSVEVASGRLSIRATSFSAYFDNLDVVRPFYESLFEIVPSGQLNGVDTYQFSSSGFLTLVEGADDLHSPTEQNAVTLSFLTSEIDGWFERATNWPGFELRTPEIIEEGGGLVRVFVGYDPEGIFLEWDTFQDAPGNEEMVKYLP